jgi:phosphonopyruvate decarboxylase
MIRAQDFIEPAKALGFRLWSGVPCSFLTPLINRVIDDCEMRYVAAANEGDAVATASGAALAGQPAVAMMQNSGLGNAVSPLSSLNWVFRIPILLIVTLRGEPGFADEPQHELMGQVTGRLLDGLQIAWAWFPRQTSDIEGALTVARWHMERTARPYAFIMRKGSVAPGELQKSWQPSARPSAYRGELLSASDARLTRCEALQAVIDCTPVERCIVIATTGYTGRELFALSDRPNQLYLVGSMGCASSFGLGLSLALPGRDVVVVDGDGAALMRMGNFATAGAYGGENFRHLLLDNAVHESTGGQPTVSPAVSFAAVAAACGYRQTEEAVTPEALRGFLTQARGPALQHFRIRRGVPEALPRPDVGPVDVCRRLMRHLGIEAAWAAG